MATYLEMQAEKARAEAKRRADELRRSVGLPVAGETAADVQRRAEAKRRADELRRSVALPSAGGGYPPGVDAEMAADKRAVAAGRMTPDDFMIKHGTPEPSAGPGFYWLTTAKRIHGEDIYVRQLYQTRAGRAESEEQQERAIRILTQIAAAFNGGGLAVTGMAGGKRVSNVAVRG
jgi:hypothetical protein